MVLSDVLDLIGLLLVVAGLAALVAVLVPVAGVPVGLVVAGAGVLGVSWISDRRAS